MHSQLLLCVPTLECREPASAFHALMNSSGKFIVCKGHILALRWPSTHGAPKLYTSLKTYTEGQQIVALMNCAARIFMMCKPWQWRSKWWTVNNDMHSDAGVRVARAPSVDAATLVVMAGAALAAPL